MDLDENVLLYDNMIKRASQLVKGDKLYLGDEVDNVLEFTSKLYEIRLYNGITLKLDYLTKILVFISDNPYINHDAVKEEFNIEYIEASSKLRRLILPISRIQQINIIRNSMEQIKLLQLHMLDRLINSPTLTLGKSGVFLLSSDMIFSEIESIKNLGAKKCIRFLTELTEQNGTCTPFLLASGHVVQ